MLFDLVTMRAGPRLSQEACNLLVQPISKHAVDKALSGIEDNKAPGLDGFNSFFFKKSWPVIKDTVYDAVNEFFDKALLHKPLNSTSNTLIPKVEHAIHAKEFN